MLLALLKILLLSQVFFLKPKYNLRYSTRLKLFDKIYLLIRCQSVCMHVWK